MSSTDPRRVCIFGAAPSTANLGVSALLESTILGLLARHPATEISVFDYAWRPGPLTLPTPSGPAVLARHGANPSRRYWSPETLGTMRVAGRLRLPGFPGVSAVRRASAVLDLSGGDSFTDLYGVKRFWTVTHPKRLALDLGRPLFLLPQTYGPFENPKLRGIARDTVRRARLAWARDDRSFAALNELLGPEADAERHRAGIDMAFALQPQAPAAPLDDDVERWFSEDRPVVGLNVSGLLWSASEGATNPFGIRGDYRAIVEAVARGVFAASGDTHLVLVPHVLEPPGHPESDRGACLELVERLPEKLRERVRVLAGTYRAGEIKHLIGRLDWFTGARMHATIAGLSTGVPSTAMAYSGKFQGVFERCGQGDAVADLRALSTDEAIASVLAGHARRVERRAELATVLPGLLDMAQRQLDTIDAVLAGLAAGASSGIAGAG